MPTQAKTSPFVLFFDCFIVSSKLSVVDAYRTNYPPHDDAIRSIRTSDTAYRHVSKLSVVKYTLLSYAAVPWDEMVLRVECEDEEDRVEFFSFARRHFPFANIVNERCATAAQFVTALTPLRQHGNPWIFFSPNNDHPLIGDPNAFAPLIELAEEIEPLYPGFLVGILFSHFTESHNTVAPDQHDWSRYMGNMCMVVGETKHARVVESSLFCCDSIRIHRLSTLLTLFSTATETGRCIRLEDTGHYMTTNFHELVIHPKDELCRHFDGYGLFLETTPPCFIPDGFFESDIKVRYGFNARENGCVNVNPYEDYSYLGGAADIRCLLSELPDLWKTRISSVEVNPEMGAMYRERRNEAFQLSVLKYPYSDSFVLTNYMRSAWCSFGKNIREFREDLCNAVQLTIPDGQRVINTAAASTGVTYFVFSGVVLVDEEYFHKFDIIAFQGKCSFIFEAVGGDAKVIQVSLPLEGVPSKRRHIWRALHP